MKNFNTKFIVMTASVMISSVSLSAPLDVREYKGGCHKTYGEAVVIQKKHDRYTLSFSVGNYKTQKKLTLFGDSFAIHFNDVNHNYALLSEESINRSVANGDESIVFTCSGVTLDKENYVTYELDVDTYEILVKQKYLKKSEKFHYH